MYMQKGELAQVQPPEKKTRVTKTRRGVFIVLVLFSMVGIMAFVGMSVDIGMITVMKTRMQASADAAALAGAQEIVVAIRNASSASSGTQNVDAILDQAGEDAKVMAAFVAQANGFYVNPATDVDLGRRQLAADGSYTETWGTGPYNLIRVNIHKDNEDAGAPDAKMPLIFAPVFGRADQKLLATATAFIESRDIVCTLDYSASMNDDSILATATTNRLGKSAVEANLDLMWSALTASDVRYSDETGTQKFPSGGYGRLSSAAGTYVSSDNDLSVLQSLEIYTPEQHYYDNWSLNTSGDDYRYKTSGGYDWRRYTQGTYKGKLRRKSTNSSNWSTVAESTAPGYFPTIPETCIPWPQEGRNDETGLRLGKPSVADSIVLWMNYVDYVRNNGGLNSLGYRKKYGFRTLMHYLMVDRPSVYESEDLWRTPHYPFHAMKMGMSTFCDFMTELSYGDNVGLVNYATEARLETGLNDDGVATTVSLGDELLSRNYADINTISMHRQAGHYTSNTAIGAGIGKARELISSHGRDGAQKAILLMTDGQANVAPSGFKLPTTWNWNALFDYDGNGSADYTTSNMSAQYALYQAKLAADDDIVVHTLCVGAGADVSLMRAISHLSGGLPIVVPGGTSLAEMETQLREAFALVAGQVPPARLVVSEEE